MVYECHSAEIELYQLAAGNRGGRLLFATAILSDVEEILGGIVIGNDARERIIQELKEVKELLIELIKEEVNGEKEE